MLTCFNILKKLKYNILICLHHESSQKGYNANDVFTIIQMPEEKDNEQYSNDINVLLKNFLKINYFDI